jgi:flagellar hook-associated protein 3 FlgL
VDRLELGTDRLEDMRISLSEMLSQAEDADLAQAVVDLKTQENIYEASAAAAARIGQLTLLDYLR